MVIDIRSFNPEAVLTNIVKFCDKTGLHGWVDPNDYNPRQKTK